jgi:hypothetical protein
MEMPVGAIAGSALDAWQRPLSDLGMTGPDQGKGGKYVFIGPGQEAPAAEGTFVLRSPTFGVVLFYRTLDPDQAKGEALAKRIRIYPWAKRDDPTPIRFLKPDPNALQTSKAGRLQRHQIGSQELAAVQGRAVPFRRLYVVLRSAAFPQPAATLRRPHLTSPFQTSGFAELSASITLQPVGGKREFVVQVRFAVNVRELRRACRRLVSRLSDESEIGTDFAVFHATGMAMELSTGNSSEVLPATIHRSGQATVPRPVFSKLVSALRYFRGTEIEFEFSAE